MNTVTEQLEIQDYRCLLHILQGVEDDDVWYVILLLPADVHFYLSDYHFSPY